MVKYAKRMESLQHTKAKLIENMVLVWSVTVDLKYAKIVTFKALN